MNGDWLRLVAFLVVTMPIVAALFWAAAAGCKVRYLRVILPFFPLALGARFGVALANVPHGYVAVFPLVGAVFLSILQFVTASLMCVSPRTRRAGKVGLVAAVLTFVGFAASWQLLESLDLVPWREHARAKLRMKASIGPANRPVSEQPSSTPR